jgi:hypothetical protein
MTLANDPYRSIVKAFHIRGEYAQCGDADHTIRRSMSKAPACGGCCWPRPPEGAKPGPAPNCPGPPELYPEELAERI